MDLYDAIDDAEFKAEALLTALRKVQDLTVPSIPQNVAASASGSTVTITWSDSVGARGISTYKIYRDGVFLVTDITSPYADQGLVSGTYTYSVSAVDGRGTEGSQGSASPVVVTVGPPLPDAPINFTAINVSSSQNNLAWVDGPSGGATSDYDVDFSTNGGSSWTSLSVGLQLAFSHTGLSPGTYLYRLKAKNVSGDSAYVQATAIVVAAASTVLFGLGNDLTTTASWRSTDDVVNGWDWSYAPGTVPAAFSGMFQFGNNLNNWPPNFPGNKIYKIDGDDANGSQICSWRNLEPTQGSYSGLGAAFNKVSSTSYSGWAGFQIDIRGTVYNGNSPTAPSWINVSTFPSTGKQTNNAGDGYFDVSYSQWYTPFRQLITQVCNFTPPAWNGVTYKLLEHPRVICQIIHGQSNTAGEEQGMGDTPANHVETCRQWGVAAGAYRYKQAWAGEGDAADLDVMNAGLGARGGIIEVWLRQQYTPRGGSTSDTGQRTEAYKTAAGASVADNYYLTVDETYPIIEENRHWGDQNEEYRASELTNPNKEWGLVPEKWHIMNRMSWLTVLRMRRNICAVETPGSFKSNTGSNAVNGLNVDPGSGNRSFVNPPLINWVSLQLGKRVDGVGGSTAIATEAICGLNQTWAWGYPGSGSARILLIHNIPERWLTQREIVGGTSVSNNQTYGWNATRRADLDSQPALWSMNTARKMNDSSTGIGFRLDDDFIGRPGSGGTTVPVAIKVTYVDNNTHTWTLNYFNSAGTAQTKSVTNNNTGVTDASGATSKVKTATFFLSNFGALATALTDFRITGSLSTQFMFARVIKT